MRLAFRCVVRNGIRRFQFAEPANDPVRAAPRRADGARGGRRGDRRRADVLDQPGAHARVLRGARRGARGLRRTSTASTSRIPAACSRRTPCASSRRTSSRRGARSSCTATARSGSRRSSTWPASTRASTCSTPRSARRGAGRPSRRSSRRSGISKRRATRTRSTRRRSPTSSAYFRDLVWEKRLPPGAPREYDAAYYHHQLPGGMVTTTTRMLEEIGRPELFPAVLEEIVRVRAEMGYPILVTPVSQFMATQAFRNVVDAERWTTVSDETVRYFLGHYGDFPAPPDPDVADRVLSLAEGRVAPRRAAGQPRRRAAALRRGDLGRGAAAAADDAAGAGGRDARRAADRRARGVRRRRRPSSARPAAARGRAARVDLVPPRPEGRRPRGVAPCLLRASAAFVFDIDGTLVHRTGPEEVHAIPGAREVLDRIAASGRPFAVFTNGSHVPPDAFARAAARCGAAGRGRAGAHAAVLASRATSNASAARRASCRSRPSRARAYLDEVGDRARRRRERHAGRRRLRRARRPRGLRASWSGRRARSSRGARLLTGSYVPAYAGADGPILSRGAMITAAIAKASSARPVVVGKPSQAAVRVMRQPARRPLRGDRDGRRRLPPRRRARTARPVDDRPRPQRHQRGPRPRPRAGGAEARPDRSEPSRSCWSGCDARGRDRRAGRSGGSARHRARRPRSGARRGASRRPRRRGQPDGHRACGSAATTTMPPPWVPGMDAAGTVESVGAGVDRLAVGDEVMAAVMPRRPEGGAQAELVVVPAASVVPIPAGRHARAGGDAADERTDGAPRSGAPRPRAGRDARSSPAAPGSSRPT